MLTKRKYTLEYIDVTLTKEFATIKNTKLNLIFYSTLISKVMLLLRLHKGDIKQQYKPKAGICKYQLNMVVLCKT